MILIDVKNYLKAKSVSNLQAMAIHFQRDPEVMRDMLAHWVRKGVVVVDEKPVSCGVKCIQCKPEVAAVYRYVCKVSGAKFCAPTVSSNR